MLRAPCYDTHTKQDCPLRRVHCRQTCSRWQLYQIAKAEEEARKKKEARFRDVEINAYNKSIQRMKRRHGIK